MKLLSPFIFMIGAMSSSLANSQQAPLSAGNSDEINIIARKIYNIPYRDVICAFSDLKSFPGKYPEYANKKFENKKIESGLIYLHLEIFFQANYLKNIEADVLRPIGMV